MDRTALPAPLIHPDRIGSAVVLSIPHSGRTYPGWLVEQATGGQAALQQLEDPLVDRLAWRAIGAGHGAVMARTPRAAIDCNRAPEDLDPAVIGGLGPDVAVTARARHGLGIVPARAGHGALWRRPIDRIELDLRLGEAWNPYHDALEGLLDAAACRHGTALLLDCHSMPPRPGQADIVIGDRHGRSAAGWIAREAAAIARTAGFSVAMNDPYAGGEIIARHGRPDDGLHALQIEIDRSLYLDESLRQPGPGFDRVARFLELLATSLGAALRAPAAAAE